jgi:hypothetical protein
MGPHFNEFEHYPFANPGARGGDVGAVSDDPKPLDAKLRAETLCSLVHIAADIAELVNVRERQAAHLDFRLDSEGACGKRGTAIVDLPNRHRVSLDALANLLTK